MEDLASPVGAFVRERCVTGPGNRVPVEDLYREWRSWCEVHGKTGPGTVETFGRDLRAAVPAVAKTRPREAGGRVWYYSGIRVRVPTDPDEDPGAGPGGHGDRAPQPCPEGVARPEGVPPGRPGPTHRRFRSDDRPHAERW